MLDPELQLLAGTSFLFSREELDQHVDTLFVDEGGQVALADALAVGTAARNLVLLGDPNQLAQVSQGAHPPGANASVLEHLLGERRDGAARTWGIFLEQTWRMRPEVNAYISETFYEGRLEPARGLRASGRSRTATACASCRSSTRATGTRRRRRRRSCATRSSGCSGRRTPTSTASATLQPEDIIVVAPYNAQVRCLRAGDPRRADPGRHGRQVPGPGGAGRLLLDGELERRGRPARPRLPVLAQPAERRDLAREVPRVPGREPAAARRELPDGRADAARERAVPVRRAGRRPSGCLNRTDPEIRSVGRALVYAGHDHAGHVHSASRSGCPDRFCRWQRRHGRNRDFHCRGRGLVERGPRGYGGEVRESSEDVWRIPPPRRS